MTSYDSNVPKISILNKTVEGQKYSIGYHVNHVNFKTHINVPAGTFRIDLIPNTSGELVDYGVSNLKEFWLKTIQIQDIISIGITSEGSFLGSVDGIYEAERSEINNYEKSVAIVGRNFGKFLLDDNITSTYELSTNERAVKLLGKTRTEFLGALRGLLGQEKGIFVNRNPLVPIMWIMANMPSIHSNILFADYDKNGNVKNAFTSKVGGLFEFDLKVYQDQKVFAPKLNQYFGSVWNYLMSCIDPMYYEIYVDTVLGEAGGTGEVRQRLPQRIPKPCLVVRPKPFNRSTDNVIQGISDPLTGTGKQYASKVINPKFPADFNPQKDENEIWRFEMEADKQKPINWLWDNHVTPSDYVTRATGEPFHTVSQEDDWGRSVGVDIKDMVNVYTVRPTLEILNGTSLSTYTLLFPLLDAYSIKRYGMKRLEGFSNLLQVDTKSLNPSDPNLFQPKTHKSYYKTSQYAWMRDVLFNWYRYNPIFYKGSDRVKGDDKYRVGDKVYFPHHIAQEGLQGVHYYIEGVNNTWRHLRNTTSYESILEINRGENIKFLEHYRTGVTGYSFFDSGDVSNENNPVIAIGTIELEGEASGKETTNEETTEEDNNEGVKDSKGQSDFTGALTEKNIKKIKAKYDANKSQWGSKTNTAIKGDFGESNLNGEFVVTFNLVISELNDAAASINMNANLLAALIDAESAFKPQAVSNSGCSGLGQFEMKTGNGHVGLTYKNMFKQGSSSITNKEDQRFNPIRNIRGTASILREKGWRKNDLETSTLALRSYGSPYIDYMQYLYGKSVKEFFPESKLNYKIGMPNNVKKPKKK